MNIICQDVKTFDEIRDELNEILADMGDLLGEENLLWL